MSFDDLEFTEENIREFAEFIGMMIEGHLEPVDYGFKTFKRTKKDDG